MEPAGFVRPVGTSPLRHAASLYWNRDAAFWHTPSLTLAASVAVGVLGTFVTPYILFALLGVGIATGVLHLVMACTRVRVSPVMSGLLGRAATANGELLDMVGPSGDGDLVDAAADLVREVNALARKEPATLTHPDIIDRSTVRPHRSHERQRLIERTRSAVTALEELVESAGEYHQAVGANPADAVLNAKLERARLLKDAYGELVALENPPQLRSEARPRPRNRRAAWSEALR